MKALAMLSALLLLWAPTYDNAVIYAEDITAESSITLPGGGSTGVITNKSQWDSVKIPEGEILIEAPEQVAAIYIIWEKLPGEWIVGADGQKHTAGQMGFLHEFISIEQAFERAGALSLTIEIPPDGARMCEIYLFTYGQLPEWVQIWQPQLEKADILLMSTHADDEHLYFAGILPYYAGQVGAAVQVSYLVHHWNSSKRPHELLDGLWAVGVTAYPVISGFPDLYSTSLSQAQNGFAARGFTEDDFIAYQVELIRAFRPQVVINHDVNGEYGHGAHMLNTYIMKMAVEAAADEQYLPELAELYGVWDVPKTYIHMWKENTVEMDWDVPLTRFNGKTAFEMSQQGFLLHKSQHWPGFYSWLMGSESKPVTKASQITRYSPREFGLYRSTVGPDTGLNDFLENITMYKDVKPPARPLEEAPQQIVIPEPEPLPAPVFVPKRAAASIETRETEPAAPQPESDYTIYIAAGAAAMLTLPALSAIRRFSRLKKDKRGTKV